MLLFLLNTQHENVAQSVHNQSVNITSMKTT